MIDTNFIFIAGHHRSGTSLLHRMMRDHPLVSGISKTVAKQDEGQHLQSIYPTTKACGGPGKYIFNRKSYMNEHHPLATEQSAAAIMQQWAPYFDPTLPFYVEKSPSNLIRTRFLQKLFPNSRFLIIIRHPAAVSYATQKWSRTPMRSLVEHTLRGYEIFADDLSYLKHARVLRYENLVQNPQQEIDRICDFLKIPTAPIEQTILPDINQKYFQMWRENRKRWLIRISLPLTDRLEQRANRFGYSFRDLNLMPHVPIFGEHHQAPHPTPQTPAPLCAV